MSLADNIFIDMCKDVIENGTITEGEMELRLIPSRDLVL